MRAMRLSVCWALLLLGNVFSGGCTAMPAGEPSFGSAGEYAEPSGKQGFGFTSFGISTFEDNNGDGLPDRRIDGKPGRAAPDAAANALAEVFPYRSQVNQGTVTTHSGERLAYPDAPGAIREQKMIYRGGVQVEVARVEDSIGRYAARVQEWGGYLSVRDNAQITVRVPAARFTEAMAELRSYGRVLHESMQANEVTREHTDLTIRLENALKGRDRLLALLAKAEKVEDMLKIEEHLRRLTEEVERMTGELRLLNDQVAMSTIIAAFQGVAEQPDERRRTPNMFSWINQIGVEPLRRGF